MYKVVVIDDEVLVRRGIVLETDWKALDCMVVAEAENGLGGLEAVHKYDPEILICDIKMPQMDGITMLQQLREEGNDVSVIFLTAYGEFKYAQSALKLLASDYLLKPFQDGALEEAVLRVIGQIRERRGKENEGEDKLPILTRKSGDKSKYVMSALDYISEHYSDADMGIADIAVSIGISESHLSHIFKKETDYTVAAYITRYRMRIAMRLLSDGGHKVYEVAGMVGYRDIAYFSSTFKKIVGVNPSEYQDRGI